MLNIPALLFSCADWCLLWLILLAICVRHFPWAIAHDYPRDMQDCAALPAPSNAQKKRSTIFAALSFVLLFASALASVWLAFDWRSVPFATVLCHLWLMGMAWNAVDLLLVDWLLICTLASPLFILPNSAHCAGRRDFRFHFIVFLKGGIAMSLISGVLAMLAFAVMRVAR